MISNLSISHCSKKMLSLFPILLQYLFLAVSWRCYFNNERRILCSEGVDIITQHKTVNRWWFSHFVSFFSLCWLEWFFVNLCVCVDNYDINLCNELAGCSEEKRGKCQFLVSFFAFLRFSIVATWRRILKGEMENNTWKPRFKVQSQFKAPNFNNCDRIL